MRAFVRGCGWFVASLLIAGLVLRATVFDLWTVASPPAGGAVTPLAAGDVVLVLRESKATPGNLARCTATDGTGHFALRVPSAPSGTTDKDDLPKAASLVTPRKKSAKRTSPGAREGSRPALAAATSPTPAATPTSPLAPHAPVLDTTCRRVVLRLWGDKGPLDPDRRLTLLE